MPYPLLLAGRICNSLTTTNMNINECKKISDSLYQVNAEEIVKVYLGSSISDLVLIIRYKSYIELGYGGTPTWFIIYSFKNNTCEYLLMICGHLEFSKTFVVWDSVKLITDLESTSPNDLSRLLLNSRDIERRQFNLTEGYRICSYLLNIAYPSNN